MPAIDYNPSVQVASDLHKGIRYNQTYDVLESHSSMSLGGNVTCGGITTGGAIHTGTLTSPTINSSAIYANTGTLMINGTGCQVAGELTLGSDKAYINFHNSMMKALYASVDEKDQEFCMPTIKSKLYLGQLINHMNEHDAEKVLRALYLTLSQLPMSSEHLPSQKITTSIIEFAVKENL